MFKAIGYITKYLGSEAVFNCNARLSGFGEVDYGLPDSRIIDLIDDTAMFPCILKCVYQDSGTGVWLNMN